MNENEPASGAVNVWLAYAAFDFSMICCLLAPANAHSVRFKYCGSTERTAGGLKQFGARILGSQNSVSPNGAVQARSMKQTKPFLPFTAVSYPWLPSTSTSALAEIDGGAALRASAISSSALMRYSASGAMTGWDVGFLSSAFAREVRIDGRMVR